MYGAVVAAASYGVAVSRVGAGGGVGLEAALLARLDDGLVLLRVVGMPDAEAAVLGAREELLPGLRVPAAAVQRGCVAFCSERNK